MKLRFLIVMSAVAIIGAACSKSDHKSRLGRASDTVGASMNGGGTGFPGSPDNLPGAFYYGDQSQFDTFVRAFVTSFMPPERLGQVSANPADTNTGIRFGGGIYTVNGGFNPNNNQTAFDTEHSQLIYAIWNSNDINSGTRWFVPLTSAQVSSSRAVLTFSDDMGSVTLDGTISNQDFYGSVSFIHRQTYDGNPGYSGPLGYFYIQTCSFFAC
jgi:hypothetical protein